MAVASAAQPARCSTTACQYDPWSLLANVTQSFNSTSTGPATQVARTYDTCGQLVSDVTLVASKTLSSVSQAWDEAGRRAGLYRYPGMDYGFIYQADRQMVAADRSVFS